MATNNWLVRIGNGDNFISSSRYGIWGVQSSTSDNKYFLRKVTPGDRLWFVKNNSKGKIIAVATYQSHNVRVSDAFVNSTMSNAELGWTGEGPNWTSDIEIHYTELYGLNNCDMLSHIKGPKTVREYNEKCLVNLVTEYDYIVRYSRVTLEM
jgi:hypothetical protein